MTVTAIATPAGTQYRLDDGRRLAILPELSAWVWLAQAGLDDRAIGQALSDAEHALRSRP